LAAAWLVLTFALSVAPGALARWGGPELALEGVPCLPLALVPWLAIAGWPRGAQFRQGTQGKLSAASVVGLMLPALALALAADLEAAYPVRALVGTTAWGAVLCGALAWAAERGDGLRAGVWLALVPGCAMLLAAWAFVGSAAVSAAPASWLAASPLAWSMLEIQRLRGAEAARFAIPLGPLAVVALLAVLGARGSKRSGA
jgi:hypothetical protein